MKIDEKNRYLMRAWHKEQKKMYEVEMIAPYQDEHTTGGEVFLKGIPRESFYFPEEVEILQCTGRKDRNGELIFEGDILRSYFDTPDGEEYEDSEVRYDYEELCWGLYTKKLNFMDTYGLGSEFSSKDHEILKHYGEEAEKC